MTTWVNTIRQIADGEALNATNLNKAANDANQNATYCKENIPSYYVARLTSTGVFSSTPPSGWSVSHPETGHYVFTFLTSGHGGADANLFPFAQVDGANGQDKAVATIENIGSGSPGYRTFRVVIVSNNTGNPTDRAFSIFGIVIP